MALISTPGPDANSYASLQEAKDFWDLNRYVDYSTYTDAELEQSLQYATSQLDVQYGTIYSGELEDEDNALFWPRTGVTDARGISITDYSEFPRQLKEATACFTWSILQSNRNAEVDVDAITEKTLSGVGTLKFDTVGAKKSAQNKPVVPTECEKYLTGLIKKSTNRYTELFVRG